MSADFKIYVEGFTDRIPLKNVFSAEPYKGENISPKITWENAPAGTKSFAVSFYDPDAPTGSGWWHWFVVNIPAHINKIPENAGNEESKLLPTGALQLRNDYGDIGYGGPCPPQGAPHRYIMTVFALGVEKLDITATASNALAGSMVNRNCLAKVFVQALFGSNLK